MSDSAKEQVTAKTADALTRDKAEIRATLSDLSSSYSDNIDTLTGAAALVQDTNKELADKLVQMSYVYERVEKDIDTIVKSDVFSPYV